MNLETYKRTYEKSDTGPGWEAIDARLRTLYGDQEPVHFIASAHSSMGGPDPLNGISAYASSNGGIQHLHFVSYGMSELFYDESAFGGEVSGFGFEFTFRLKAPASEKKKHGWLPSVMQNLARYLYKSGQTFDDYHFLPTQGPIWKTAKTAITAIAFAEDPELGIIDTPHGTVKFLQMVGITGAEFDAEVATGGENIPALLDWLRIGNPLLVTDLQRV